MCENVKYFLKYKFENIKEVYTTAAECLQMFDHDRDGYLNKYEFGSLLTDLFSQNGQPYRPSIADECFLQNAFTVIDKNKVGKISTHDLSDIWKSFIQPVCAPRSCLLVVDVQNDFISGSLALCRCPAKQHGEHVIPIINTLLQDVNFHQVVYTQDWHPHDHCSFIDNVKNFKLKSNNITGLKDMDNVQVQVFDTVTLIMDNGEMEQKLWPAHCVQESWGAELHQDLKVVDKHIKIHKGRDATVDCYSAFKDINGRNTELRDLLNDEGITHVFIAGLAYDICVAETAKDSLYSGFVTFIVDDGCRGVNVDDIVHSKEDIASAGGIIIPASKVPGIVEGLDRQVEMAEFCGKGLVE